MKYIGLFSTKPVKKKFNRNVKSIKMNKVAVQKSDRRGDIPSMLARANV